jgi:uncharacterized protein YPO0396
MEQVDLSTIHRDLVSLKKSINEIKMTINDLQIIKTFLYQQQCADPEGELTDWAKNELAEARNIPDPKMISLEVFEKKFFEDDL